MIAALIIAVGKAMGKDGLNPQKKVGTISALERIVMTFKLTGLSRIVVACCENDVETEKLAAHMGVDFLYQHKNSETLESIKAGLSYLQDKCTAAMITPAYVPLFSVETLRELMAAEGKLCIPSYQGSTGYPILLQAEYFQSVLSYAGDWELDSGYKPFGLQHNIVEVHDEGILSHVDNENSYKHLLDGHALRRSHPDIRIRIAREKPFYGPGAHHLLQLTDEAGSLRKACRMMGISYGKGRKIISRMEQQLGHELVISQQGGSAGGHSVLTDECKVLMAKYVMLNTEANQCLQVLFERYFGE